jgi:hypothetical protein
MKLLFNKFTAHHERLAQKSDSKTSD